MNIVKAVSAKDTDVQQAINACKALGGGVVEMPAGQGVSWTVGIDKLDGVNLIGQGEGITHIVDNVPKDGTEKSMAIRAEVSAPNTEIAGFTLEGFTPDLQVMSKGHIRLQGKTETLNMHDIEILNNQTPAIRTVDAVFGCIHHMKFITHAVNIPFLLVDHGGSFGDASGFGDGSWRTPIYWGSTKALYVEDCDLRAIFANPAQYVSSVIDNFVGGRLVFRNNYTFQCSIGSHGSETGQRFRSCRQYEVYRNHFDFAIGALIDKLIWLRGGTGRFWGNKVTNAFRMNAFNVFVGMNLKRDEAGYPPWGKCDGTGPYDENVNGVAIRCVDQVGAGTSRDFGGLVIPTPGWAENQIEPAYVYDNDLSDTPTYGVAGGSHHVLEGRDYFLTPPPAGTYTPLVYPHPIQTGSTPPPVVDPIPTPTPEPPMPNTPPTISMKLYTSSGTVIDPTKPITVKNVKIVLSMNDDAGPIWTKLYVDGQVVTESGNSASMTYTWNTAPWKGRSPVLKGYTEDAGKLSATVNVPVKVAK